MSLPRIRPYILSLLWLGLAWFVLASAMWAWPFLLVGSVIGLIVGVVDALHSNLRRSAAGDHAPTVSVALRRRSGTAIRCATHDNCYG